MPAWLDAALDYIPRWLEFQVRLHEQPGCVIAIAYRGALVHEQAFGPLTPRGLLARFVVLNVFLAVFNMIPVPPLDGGNVLAGFVPESVARVIDQMRPWGFLILYALLFMGVLDEIVSPIARWILEMMPL